MGPSAFTLWPAVNPVSLGPPAGELQLAPLMEALGPEQLVQLLMAVVLERRVLLRVSASAAGTVVALVLFQSYLSEWACAVANTEQSSP